MRIRHPHESRETIQHDAAASLFPLGQLEGTIHRYRDAQLKRESANASQIVTVGPTGLASSYFLAQHPLSLIELGTLSPKQRDELSTGTELDLAEFKFIQVGRGDIQSQNHSLRALLNPQRAA